MPLEREQFLSCDSVPELDGIVPASRGQAIALGRDGHAADRSLVPFERGQEPTRARIPHLHSMIETPRDDSPTVRRERD